MPSLAELMDKVKSVWNKLDLNQKVGLTLATAMLLVGLVSLGYWATRPTYTVLYTKLDPADANAITSILREQGVQYRLPDSGTIEVPSGRVHEVRLQMAGEGIPQGGVGGFEIFDQTGLGMSEFVQKLNFRRALEGELARTIAQLEEIEGARVHIVVPEPVLYTETEKPATASVVLRPRPGTRLSEMEVQGITNLVAASVEGLQPDNVTVLDTTGQVLSEPIEAKEAALARLTQSQLEAKEVYERGLEQRIESMLHTVLGVDGAVVRVSADLDFTEAQIDSEIYEQGSPPVIRSEQTTRERYVGEGTPGEVPGVDAEFPTYPAEDGELSSEYSRSEAVTNYEVSKHIQREITPPGRVEKLSVAVVLNEKEGVALPVASIEEAVGTAAGIDMARGDVLTVSAVPFDRSWLEREEEALVEAQRQAFYWEVVRYAVIAVLFIIGIIVLTRLLRAPRLEEEPIPALVGPPLPPEELSEDINGKSKERLRAETQVKRLAKDKPADVARLLRIWMSTND